jgi:hypothetical protein
VRVRGDDMDEQQRTGCPLNGVGGRRNRTGQRERGGVSCGGGGVKLARKCATEDTYDHPLDGGGVGARNVPQQTWSVAFQILILALLLSVSYRTSKEPLEVKNLAGRTGPRTTFSFSDDRSSVYHKSTASWSLHVLEEELGRGVTSNRDVGAVLEMRDAFMAVCTTKLVDKRPLTAWERSVLQTQTYYEADHRRTERSEGPVGGVRRIQRGTDGGGWDTQPAERGTEHGSPGVEQHVGSDHNRHSEGTIRVGTGRTAREWNSVECETPVKRQRLGDVVGDTRPEVREGTASAPWSHQRQALTILCREVPQFLEVSEVVKLIDNPLTTLIGTMKHMANRRSRRRPGSGTDRASSPSGSRTVRDSHNYFLPTRHGTHSPTGRV